MKESMSAVTENRADVAQPFYMVNGSTHTGSQQYLSINWSLTNDRTFLFIQKSPCFVLVHAQLIMSPPGTCTAMVSDFVYQHLPRDTKFCAFASQLCSSSFFLSLYRSQNPLSQVTLLFSYCQSCGFLIPWFRHPPVFAPTVYIFYVLISSVIACILTSFFGYVIIYKLRRVSYSHLKVATHKGNLKVVPLLKYNVINCGETDFHLNFV